MGVFFTLIWFGCEEVLHTSVWSYYEVWKFVRDLHIWEEFLLLLVAVKPLGNLWKHNERDSLIFI